MNYILHLVTLSILLLVSVSCHQSKRKFTPSLQIVNSNSDNVDENGRPPCDYANDIGSKHSSHIGYGEIMDTTFYLLCKSDLTLPMLFERMISIQRIGRNKIKYETDPYISKLHNGEHSDFVDSFVSKSKSDTIFIREDIYRDGSYILYLWTDPNWVYYIISNGLNLTSQKQDKEIDYITRWAIDDLQYYGSCEQYQGRTDTGSSSRCVTRAIIEGDSVRIDMFRYYKPLWPEDYDKYRHN